MALLGIVVWCRSTGQIKDFILRITKKREKSFEEATKGSDMKQGMKVLYFT